MLDYIASFTGIVGKSLMGDFRNSSPPRDKSPHRPKATDRFCKSVPRKKAIRASGWLFSWQGQKRGKIAREAKSRRLSGYRLNKWKAVRQTPSEKEERIKRERKPKRLRSFL